MCFYELSDSHIYFPVKNSSEKNLFVSAFSGCVVVGTINGFTYSENIFFFKTDNNENILNCRKFISDIIVYIIIREKEFQTQKFSFECKAAKAGAAACKTYFCKGENNNAGEIYFHQDHILLSFYQSIDNADVLLFTLTVHQFLSFLESLCECIIFSLTFKNLHILFLKSLVKDCLLAEAGAKDVGLFAGSQRADQSDKFATQLRKRYKFLKTLKNNESELNLYISSFITLNINHNTVNSNAILKSFFHFYYVTLQDLCFIQHMSTAALPLAEKPGTVLSKTTNEAVLVLEQDDD